MELIDTNVVFAMAKNLFAEWLEERENESDDEQKGNEDN